MSKYHALSHIGNIFIPKIEDPTNIRDFLTEIYNSIPHKQHHESAIVDIGGYAIIINTNFTFGDEISTNMTITNSNRNCYLLIEWLWDEQGCFIELKTRNTIPADKLNMVTNELRGMLKLTKDTLELNISPASIFEDDDEEDE